MNRSERVLVTKNENAHRAAVRSIDWLGDSRVSKQDVMRAGTSAGTHGYPKTFDAASIWVQQAVQKYLYTQCGPKLASSMMPS